MILNLTQHVATPDQKEAGVVDLPPQARELLLECLTFEDLPTSEDILRRAEVIAEIAVQNGLGDDDGDDPQPQAAMIGGAPYLMAPLERELDARGIEPVYAFSMRESAEQVQPDGSVRKVATFRHAGFVRAVAASAAR